MAPSLDKVTCPNCHAPNTYRQDNPYRPFCSSRCKLIDLGEWADENYRVGGESKASSNPEEDE